MILFYIFLSIWGFVIIRSILSYVYYWQLKEYRLDRMLDFLRSPAGKISRILIGLNVLFLLFFVVSFFLQRIQVFSIVSIVSFIYVFYILLSFVLILLKRFLFFRPDWSKKILLISALVFIPLGFLALYLISFPVENISFVNLQFSRFFLLHCISLWWTSFVVFLFWPITGFAKKYYYKKASKKLRKYKKLTVIGITGSFGKSTTKELLSAILSSKYKVVKTPKNRNTEMGVATFILETDFSNYDVFVVEMGAYKRGEIKTVCNVVRPRIGILTGINAQHISLFGSQENIVKAKFELIQSLPSNGIAIMNGDNEFCRELFKKVHTKKKYLFSQKEELDIYASKIYEDIDGICFDVHYGRGKMPVKIPIVGKYNVSNILAGIMAGLSFGMSFGDAMRGLLNIQPIEKTMNPHVIKEKKVVLIDDSYNANPDGVLAGLTYIEDVVKRRDKKTAFVFSTMIELGKVSREMHEKVAQKAFQVSDYVLIFKSEYADIFREEAEKQNIDSEKFLITDDMKESLVFLNNKVSTDSVILFESRGVRRIFTQVKNTMQ